MSERQDPTRDWPLPTTGLLRLRQIAYYTAILTALAGALLGFRMTGPWGWIWPVLLLALVLLEHWFGSVHARRVLAEQATTTPEEQPHCMACGYQLAGLQTRRCPECGRPFDPNEKPYVTPAERLDWQALVRSMLLGLLLAGALLATGVFKRLTGGQSMQIPHLLLDPFILGGLGCLAIVVVIVGLVGHRRMQRYRVPVPAHFDCAHCGHAMPTPLSEACPACRQTILCEHVFIRCRPWNLLDARYRRMHRFALIGQALLNLLIFLALIGLLAWQSFGQPGFLELRNALIALAALIAGILLIRQWVGEKWDRRTRLLFTQAVPSCPACDASLVGKPIRGTCPNCNRRYSPQDAHG